MFVLARFMRAGLSLQQPPSSRFKLSQIHRYNEAALCNEECP